MLEAVSTSETSANFYATTPEDSHLGTKLVSEQSRVTILLFYFEFEVSDECVGVSMKLHLNRTVGSVGRCQ
jgi:hypothetical protein